MGRNRLWARGLEEPSEKATKQRRATRGATGAPCRRISPRWHDATPTLHPPDPTLPARHRQWKGGCCRLDCWHCAGTAQIRAAAFAQRRVNCAPPPTPRALSQPGTAGPRHTRPPCERPRNATTDWDQQQFAGPPGQVHWPGPKQRPAMQQGPAGAQRTCCGRRWCVHLEGAAGRL